MVLSPKVLKFVELQLELQPDELNLVIFIRWHNENNHSAMRINWNVVGDNWAITGQHAIIRVEIVVR